MTRTVPAAYRPGPSFSYPHSFALPSLRKSRGLGRSPSFPLHLVHPKAGIPLIFRTKVAEADYGVTHGITRQRFLKFSRTWRDGPFTVSLGHSVWQHCHHETRAYVYRYKGSASMNIEEAVAMGTRVVKYLRSNNCKFRLKAWPMTDAETDALLDDLYSADYFQDAIRNAVCDYIWRLCVTNDF